MYNNVIIKRLLLTPGRSDYRDVYQRSFDVSATSGDVVNLQATFATTGVTGNNNKLYDNVAAANLSNIVSISDNTTGVVDIVNGWGTQRLRFLMEVEQQIGNVTAVSYLQGYTEFSDQSLSGRLDPNMKFYINSIVNASKMIDPNTNQLTVRPTGTYNVITDLANGQKYQEVTGGLFDGPDLKLIRPNDIIEDISMGEMYMEDTTKLVNTLGDVGDGVNLSTKSNNDPIKYFTNTINSVINAKNLSDVSYDVGDVLNSASNNTVEASIVSNPFIYQLHMVTQINEPTTFTLGILEMMDPTVSSKTTIVNGGNTIGIRETMLDTCDTADLLAPTIENKIATTVAHSISSMMADNMIMEFSASMTNATGPVIVTPTNVKSFITAIDTVSYANRVVTRCSEVLMPEITYNNAVMVTIDFTADVLGDTTVAVSYNGGPSVVYRFPVFTDSLFSPVITDTVGRKSTAESMGNIIDLTLA